MNTIVAIGVVAVSCASLCAFIASQKHRDALGWFLIGLATGLLGVIAAAGVPSLPPSEPKPQIPDEDRAPGSSLVLFLTMAAIFSGIALFLWWIGGPA